PEKVYVLAVFTVTLVGVRAVARLTLSALAVSSKVTTSPATKLVCELLLASFQFGVPPTPMSVPASQMLLCDPAQTTASPPVICPPIRVFVVSNTRLPSVRVGSGARLNPELIGAPA